MMITGKPYDVIKAIAQIYLPALGTLYFALAGIWGLPSAQEVVGTVLAVDTFLGVVLGISSVNYDKSDEKYDGKLMVYPNADGSGGVVEVNLQGQNPEKLVNEKNEVVLKVGS